MKAFKTINYFKYTYKNGEINLSSKKKIGQYILDKEGNYLKGWINFDKYDLIDPAIIKDELNEYLPVQDIIEGENELHERDEDGNLIVSTWLNTVVGDLSKETHYNSDGYLILKSNHFYDTKGEHREHFYRNADNLVTEYKDENVQTDIRKKDFEYVKKTTYKYDTNQNITEISAYLGEGNEMEITSKRVTVYNEYNDLIEDTLYEFDDIYKKDAYLIPLFTVKAEILYHK